MVAADAVSFKFSIWFWQLSVFQSVPGLQDYSGHAVLAPIVTVTKLQIYEASGREMANPQLHSRGKKLL